MTLEAASHSPNTGALVELFRLDLTSVGGDVLYFCKGAFGGLAVEFGDQAYSPFDIQVSRFQTNAGGTLPTPTLKIANSDSVIQELINTFGDLVGCEIRRVRTFKQFLDGQAEADPSAFLGPDVFRIERKTDENPVFIEYELSAAIDQQGKMLPGRQVIRDNCPKRYRVYDPTNPEAAVDGFFYTQIGDPCPYAGVGLFTVVGAVTVNPALDACGRKITDCELRFGEDQPLPFGGFPGVARTRLS
jgi:lambda family phage minor tail protein L